MKRITHRRSVRTYCAKGDEDAFDVNPHLDDVLAMELLAYYRGEPVTASIVSIARRWACRRLAIPEPPLPIKSLGVMRFICKDGVCDRYDLGTLLRHFELVSDLYELNPEVREMEVPFLVEDADRLLHRFVHEYPRNEIELIKFLRPKHGELYLYPCWEGKSMTKEFAREIGASMSKEARMANSYLAGLVPDWDLYPVVSWAYRLSHTNVLRSLLLPEYPSVYAKYLAGRILDPESAKELVTLLTTNEFKDAMPTDCKEGIIEWSSPWSMFRTITSPVKLRHCLAFFGIRHELLDNVTTRVYYPFAYLPQRDQEALDTILTVGIDQLQDIDSNFTEEKALSVLRTLRM